MAFNDSRDATAREDMGNYHYGIPDQSVQTNSIQSIQSDPILPTMDSMASAMPQFCVTPGLQPNMFFLACSRSPSAMPQISMPMAHHVTPTTPTVSNPMSPPVIPLVTPFVTPVSSEQQRGLSSAPRRTINRPISSHLGAAKGVGGSKIVCRDIYVPMEIVEGQDISHSNGQVIFMRKVRSLRAPMQVKIAGNTKWGAGYDGSKFLPNTAQHAIREAACNQEWSESVWKTKSGCFLRCTTAGQHKDSLNTLGMASLDPCFFSKDMEWRDFKRDTKVIYVPDPQTQMTQEQYSHYLVKAAQLNGPIVNLPAPVRVNLRAKRQRRRKTQDTYQDTSPELSSPELSEPETHKEESDSDSLASGTGTLLIGGSNTTSQGRCNVAGDSGRLSAHTISDTCTTVADSSVAISSLQSPMVDLDDNIWENPSRQSVISSAAMHTNPRSMFQQFPSSRWTHTEEWGYPGNTSLRPISFDNDNETTGSLSLTDEFQVDIHRQIHSDMLCAEFVDAQEQVVKLEDGSRLAIELSPKVVKPIEHRFWDTFGAILKEERTKSSDGHAGQHLECLELRREANYGLSKKMLEDIVTPLLSDVPSLAPYSKLHFEHEFEVLALPSWQIWEALAGMDPLLTPEYVAEHLDKSLQQIRDWVGLTSMRPKCTEEQLRKMHAAYVKWKTEVSKGAISSPFESEYLQAKKRYEDAERLMQADQISQVGLWEFRRFGYRFKQNRHKIELTDGDELGALCKMCDSVSKQNWIFSDFEVCVHIEVEEGLDMLEEHGTMDAGGPTCRFLTAAWARLFTGTAEFHVAFVEGSESGCLHHLSSIKAMLTVSKNSVKVIGALLFMLIFKQQRVHRPMTMATIAHAMGKCPTRNEFRSQVWSGRQTYMYSEDYKGYNPALYNAMLHLCKGRDQEGWEQLLESIQDMSPDVYWRLTTKVDQIKSQSEPDWCKSMNFVFADIMFDTLFVDCSHVGSMLKQGFTLFLESARSDPRMSQSDIKLVLTSAFDNCDMSAMDAFFTAELGITSAEFLKLLTYSTDLPLPLKTMFTQVVSKFSSIETYRLHRFITDEMYVSGAKCRVRFSPERSPDSLPTSSTCSRYIELPPYEDREVMHSKLLLASLCTSYGHL